MPWFQKKPIRVEAMQFTGDNYVEIARWICESTNGEGCGTTGRTTWVHTPNGKMFVYPDDWIVKDVNGYFYSFLPGVFESSFDPMESN